MSIGEQQVSDYRDDGFVVLRGLFDDWIPALRRGAEKNAAQPSNRALFHGGDDDQARFVKDFCNWQLIPEFHEFVLDSNLGEVAAALLQSRSVQFFHDHYLQKDAGASTATPWHQDMPYYCLRGDQTVSFWVPLEAREKEVSLRCVAGSHKLPKEIRPTSWSTLEDFYGSDASFMDLPDIDNGDYDIKTWAMAPGDAIAFNFKTIHGARANSGTTINRTMSFRLVGDDVRYLARAGRTSPDFPCIDQQDGDRLREDWFPVIWPRGRGQQ
jgi:ectoine hydroxylase-related dioxygenase (phytanoyl-CoA dioxygenase family)